MDWLGVMPHHCIGPLLIWGKFDTRHIEEEKLDCVTGSYARIKNGFLYPPEGSGLGVELDEEKIEKWLTPGKQITVCSKGDGKA